MLKVAISGNIGSGKSEVQNILIDMNFRTICLDDLSHQLLENDDEVKTLVVKEFKTLERDKIAKIVFEDENKRKILENIIHKKLRLKISDFYLENENEKAVFVIIPLLFEAHFEDLFDKIVFISSSQKTRLERILKRPNYDIKTAKNRMKSQIDEEYKIKRSDIVIKNEGTLSELKINTTNMLNKLHIL